METARRRMERSIVGCAGDGVALFGTEGVALRVVVAGASAGLPPRDPGWHAAARRHLERAVRADVPLRMSEGLLRGIVNRAVDGILDDLEATTSDESGVVMFATFRNGRVHTAGLGDGCVLLLRDELLVPILGGGAPEASDGEGRIHVSGGPVRLIPGDRIVLCSLSLEKLEVSGVPLRDVRPGSAAVQVQTMNDILRLTRGYRDFALALVDWDPPSVEVEAEVDLLDADLADDFADLLASVAGAEVAEPQTHEVGRVVADVSRVYDDDNGDIFRALVAASEDELPDDVGDTLVPEDNLVVLSPDDEVPVGQRPQDPLDAPERRPWGGVSAGA